MRGWFWFLALMSIVTLFSPILGQTRDKILIGTGEIFNSDGTTWRDKPAEIAIDPRLSPDKTQIVFERSGNIWTSDRDGTNRKQLTQDSFYIDRTPDWSPDGTQIVFTRLPDFETEEVALSFFNIYVMDLNGGNINRLTTIVGGARTPVWSPDGRQIAFDAQDTLVFDQGIDKIEIFLINPDGSDLTRLTNFRDGGAFAPAWSPDGSKLAFSGGLDGEGIYIIDRDGQNLTNAIMELGAYVCWSPDSSQLAYTAKRDNAWGLYTNNIEGTNERLFVSLAPNRPITCRNWFIEPQATALPFQSWGQIKVQENK